MAHPNEELLGRWFLAQAQGDTDAVRSLLAAGARADLKDDRGKTAIDIAREGNFSETMKVLEAAMKSPVP